MPPLQNTTIESQIAPQRPDDQQIKQFGVQIQIKSNNDSSLDSSNLIYPGGEKDGEKGDEIYELAMEMVG